MDSSIKMNDTISLGIGITATAWDSPEISAGLDHGVSHGREITVQHRSDSTRSQCVEILCRDAPCDQMGLWHGVPEVTWA